MERRMTERLVIEFEVHDTKHFEQCLQAWDLATANQCVGYRVDEGVAKREALRRFCDQMELKLRKNDHKTGWRDLPIEALFSLMMLEIEEFKLAVRYLTVREALKELPDISNFAMMLWDRIGSEPGDKQSDPMEQFLRINL